MALPDLTTAALPVAMVSPQLATLADGKVVWVQLYIDTVSGLVKGRIVPPPIG